MSPVRGHRTDVPHISGDRLRCPRCGTDESVSGDARRRTSRLAAHIATCKPNDRGN